MKPWYQYIVIDFQIKSSILDVWLDFECVFVTNLPLVAVKSQSDLLNRKFFRWFINHYASMVIVLFQSESYGSTQVSRQNKIATTKQNNHGKTKKPQQNKKPRQSKNHSNTKNPRQNEKFTAK